MKLRGAWRRDYSEFFDTQEALLIDAMDNADSIYTVFALSLIHISEPTRP